MKLHYTLVDKLVKIYSTYGGHREEVKLREELAKLNVIIYERQTGEKILVEEADLRKAVSESK
jgi:hypothetical protein